MSSRIRLGVSWLELLEDVFEEDAFEEDDVVFEEEALTQGSHTMRWSTWQFRMVSQ